MEVQLNAMPSQRDKNKVLVGMFIDKEEREILHDAAQKAGKPLAHFIHDLAMDEAERVLTPIKKAKTKKANPKTKEAR